ALLNPHARKSRNFASPRFWHLFLLAMQTGLSAASLYPRALALCCVPPHGAQLLIAPAACFSRLPQTPFSGFCEAALIQWFCSWRIASYVAAFCVGYGAARHSN